MKNFISDLKQYWDNRPLIWSEFNSDFAKSLRFPSQAKVLVLAPHPDDPESVSVTCRALMHNGCDIRVAIVTLSPLGVEDGYVQRRGDNGSIDLEKKKTDIRRSEQISAAERFGLTREKLTFLGAEENSGGNFVHGSNMMRDHLLSVAPDIVIMPIGKDTNRTHASVWRVFRENAKDLVAGKEKPVVALYNEDPKTLEMRHDLFFLFGEESAQWKRALLRLHDSQQQRNMGSRGIGFDERILHMNHMGYRRFQELLPHADSPARYAEAFEIELFDFPQGV